MELTFPVVTRGRFSEPAEFGNIILRADPQGAAIVRLRDVGHVEVGQKDYLTRGMLNGRPAAFLVVYQQAGANAMEVAGRVKATLTELKKGFPDGLDYTIALDTTLFVQASIDEVIHTLFEAIVLVIVVVWLFLQNLRATLIPSIAVVVSLVGAFIGMSALGFSINLLTLFGLVVAIGIVVDDAIVVVENVERNMEHGGLSPRDAAFRAMEEVTGPVIAIVLVLGAVFVPTAFMGGTTGQLYKQFAVTIAVSVAISGFVALTLTPALAALLLKPRHGEPGAFFAAFNRGFNALTERYGAGVALTIRRGSVALALVGVLLFAIVRLFGAIPTSFVPVEDQGYLYGAIMMPDGASLDRTEATARASEAVFRPDPAVRDFSVVPGYSLLDSQYKTNTGVMFISLRDYAEREGEDLSAFALTARGGKALQGIGDGIALPVNPPSIPGLGTQGGFEFWVQSKGQGDVRALGANLQKLIAEARKRPELHGVSSTLNPASRVLFLDVDRSKAETLGVPVEEIYGAVQTLFGSYYVSQFNKYSRVWQVIVQADPAYRVAPESIRNIFVRGRAGQMVPLSAVVKTEYREGADLVPRFNNFLAAKVTGEPAPGYSSGDALRAMEEVATAVLPEDYGVAWAGQAYEEKKSGGTSALVFGFGLIFVFLILAAQYESWGLPLSVITAVPFGVFGALAAIALRGIENDVYFQIGLVTLIGLSAKNAILIVEFAVMKRQEGLPVVEAAIEAAKLRLRPIVMTSLAFILGCVPLAIAVGAGANSRHSVGTGIIGGMIAATTLALFFVPLFFVLIEKLSVRFSGKPGETAPAPAEERPGA